MSETPGALGETAATIGPAGFPEDAETVRRLFLEYARWLQVDLCFQDFDRELADLPGKYRPPAGGLWLARVGEATAGVVALRPLEDSGDGEMKRLWVRPEHRGHDLGRRLIATVVEAARGAGHRRLLLDTLPPMGHAQGLYHEVGFRDIAPYYDNPIPGARYLALELG